MTPCPKPKKLRHKRLYEWTKQQRCAVPGCYGHGDAHHEDFLHSKGTGTKCHDSELIPMCRGHHREIDSPGCSGPVFYKKYNMDPKVEIIRNLTNWLLHEQEKKT